MNMQKNKVQGVYSALVTPFYKGKFDAESMEKLVRSLNPFVDGYAPCLSTGEGDKLTLSEWEAVVKTVRNSTSKPIYAGIKAKKNIAAFVKKAKSLGCAGVVLPIPKTNIIGHFDELASQMPIVLYNTEDSPVVSVEMIRKLDEVDRIIAIKDSSMNIAFFRKLLALRKEGKLRMSILQGMEHLFFESAGCDGYMTSLPNVEPKLCNDMFLNPTKATDEKVKELFWKYNLGGKWFVTIKALLYARSIIRSSEEVHMEIRP